MDDHRRHTARVWRRRSGFHRERDTVSATLPGKGFPRALTSRALTHGNYLALRERSPGEDGGADGIGRPDAASYRNDTRCGWVIDRPRGLYVGPLSSPEPSAPSTLLFALVRAQLALPELSVQSNNQCETIQTQMADPAISG